ncbi:MAG: hypothetical protein MK060_01680 [Blastomonas sp.]|uniref:hypothetical protein n=1 Tax=Blastomonas sp. TaxID=1909299 RepID=UPI00406A815F|nr:hypothetical protein [Blastomonas sp.]
MSNFLGTGVNSAGAVAETVEIDVLVHLNCFSPPSPMAQSNLSCLVPSISMLSGVIVKFFSLQVLMDHAGAALCRRSVRVFLAPLLFCFWPHAASAEHLCAERNNEYTVREVYDQTGNIIEYWCEWGDEGDAGAAAMRYFSPEEWKSFAEHGANVETQDARRRIQAGRRYRQLQDGLWFMPGEIPFAGWSSGASGSTLGSGAIRAGEDCTVSYWTPTGAVIMSTLGGKNDNAVISYMSYSIPIPNKSQFRRFSLTQSGRTQTVSAMISKVGLGSKKMGMVSFAVRSADVLVGAIQDAQDYALADSGKTIFSGQWHDGLRARDALARCLAQR